MMFMFAFLVSHANDPLSYYLTRLGDTIKEDKPQFCKLVVERSEVTTMIFQQLILRRLKLAKPVVIDFVVLW